MYNLIEDLNKITTIPTSKLDKLLDISKYLISQYVCEDKTQNEDISEIDIGFGQLLITKTEGEVKYKFIPSEDLQQLIKLTYNTSTGPLELKLEENLAKKFINTYKDLV